jgi:hypothetical protein
MKKVVLVVVVLVLLFFLVFAANIVLLSKLSSSSNNKGAHDDSRLTGVLDDYNLKKIYKIRNPKYDQIQLKIIKNFKPCTVKGNFSDIWDEANAVSILTIQALNKLSCIDIVIFFSVGGCKRNLPAV